MSSRRLVVIPTLKSLVKRSPGFAKKDLSTYKLDVLGLCEFGCKYCSSNMGNYLRVYREPFAALTEQQLGERVYPSTDPKLMFAFGGDVVEQLARELHRKPKSYGAGEVLVYSMLTDGFSPWLVSEGITRGVLDLLLDRTSFRVRVLTKNSVVGHSEWVEYFQQHRGRVVVGLSTGSLDNEWARAVEIGTSSPQSRLAALRTLQDAKVPTYGMMCPVFPDAAGRLDELVEALRPDRCETVWCEPYNDRGNWKDVRSGYAEDSAGWRWLTEVYEHGNKVEWSRYATDLFVGLVLRAEKGGWVGKLKYLLYEHGIVAEHARAYCDPRGLMLQSPADKDGKSRNPHIRAVQDVIRPPTVYDRLRINPYDAAAAEATRPPAEYVRGINRGDDEIMDEIRANSGACIECGRRDAALCEGCGADSNYCAPCIYGSYEAEEQGIDIDEDEEGVLRIWACTECGQ